MKLLPPGRTLRQAYFQWKQNIAIHRKYPDLNIPLNSQWIYDDLSVIQLGRRVSIGAWTEFVVQKKNKSSTIEGKLIVGDRSWIGTQSNIRAVGGIINIGRYCMIAQNVSINASNHSMKPNALYMDLGWDEIRTGVTVGDNVWIGAGSILLAGCSVGPNSVVAAGSVVTKAVPANEIWAGVPAKKLRVIA